MDLSLQMQCITKPSEITIPPLSSTTNPLFTPSFEISIDLFMKRESSKITVIKN